MEDYEELSQMIKTMENELYALKTKKNIAGTVKSYFYSFTLDSLANKTIQYASGTQPIITDVYTEGVCALGPVSDNKQIIFFFAQGVVEVTVVSTRPISSIS